MDKPDQTHHIPAILVSSSSSLLAFERHSNFFSSFFLFLETLFCVMEGEEVVKKRWETRGMDAHGSAGDAGGDYLTSEQREFARLKQERVDAEYAKQIDEAAATHVVSSNPRSSELGSARESSACPSPREAPYDMQHSGPCQRAAEFEEIDVRGSKSPRGSYQALPGDDGRGPELPKRPNLRKRPLPTLDTFACCISLRFGAIMIICCDLVSATFRALASFIVLTFPQLALEAEDETLFVGDVMQERAKRFLLREMRVRFFLSVMMIYFSVRGWKAVQTVEAEGSPCLSRPQRL